MLRPGRQGLQPTGSRNTPLGIVRPQVARPPAKTSARPKCIFPDRDNFFPLRDTIVPFGEAAPELGNYTSMQPEVAR